MFLNDDQWNPVTGEELKGFLSQIGTVDGRHRTNPASTKVSWRALPFYDQVVLIRVRDANWDPAHLNIFFLANQGNLSRLDGQSAPIHMVNAEAPVRINEQNILDYLRFFCFFVRGEDGPFLIAESMDDPAMPRAPDETTRRAIEGTIRPASYEGKNPDGNFMCDAIVFYSNALFLATFSVEPTGMIHMLDDQPLAQELPTRVDAPVTA